MSIDLSCCHVCSKQMEAVRPKQEKKERGGGARRAYKLLRSRRDQTAFWCRVSPIPKHAQAVSGVRTCEEVEEEEEGFFRRSRRSLSRDTQELLEWKNVREE